MKGHDALIAMRKAGHVPAVVWVETHEDNLQTWRDWQDWKPSHASLFIDPSESLASLDLRCLVGLTVQVTGQSIDRVDAVAAACSEVGPKRVITAVTRFETRGSRRFGEVVRITDSLGVIA